MEGAHGGAVRSRAIFFENGRVHETPYDGVGVARSSKNGRKGMFCEGDVEERCTADLAVRNCFD